jgi:hypothetical protein
MLPFGDIIMVNKKSKRKREKKLREELFFGGIKGYIKKDKVGYIQLYYFFKEQKRRLKILKKILEEFKDIRLAHSICMIGFESLAKIRYPETKSSEKRVLKLLKSHMNNKEEAKIFYKIYRCEYIHQGFINNGYMEDIEEISKTIVYSDIEDRELIPGVTEYTIGTIIEIYKELIGETEKYFKNKEIKERKIKFSVFRIPKFEHREETKRLKRINERRLKKFD